MKFEIIPTKGILYDKCENVEQLYDNFYFPLLVEFKELQNQNEEFKKVIKEYGELIDKYYYEHDNEFKYWLSIREEHSKLKEENDFLRKRENKLQTIEQMFKSGTVDLEELQKIVEGE